MEFLRRIFTPDKKWPEIPIEEIRKRARLLVIDDIDFYYYDLFKRDGYVIDKWDDIESLDKLEQGHYDIILLDINDVGKQYSQEQGLGILKHLKKVSPWQIIIAYSDASFSLTYQEFFLAADARLSKSEDYVQYKSTVDRLLKAQFSLGFYVDKVISIVQPYGVDVERIKQATERAILRNTTAPLEGALSAYIDKKDVIGMVLNVVQVAVGIAAICAK